MVFVCYNIYRKLRKEVLSVKKETYAKNLSYEYHAERKNAKYTLDGAHFMNHGDFCECLAKSVLGYEPKKDGNTKYNKGYDIEELHASVKSWNCGLTDTKSLRGLGFEKFITTFFNTELKDTTYIWVYEYDEYVDLWFMNKSEFEYFTRNCATYDNYSQKVRFKLCNNKINAFLEEMLKGSGN